MYGTYKYTNNYKGVLTKNFHHTWILTIKHWRGEGGLVESVKKGKFVTKNLFSINVK